MKPPNPPARALAALTLATFVLSGPFGCAPPEETGTSYDAVHSICATGNTSVRGIDVSIYQGTVDWAAAASGGVRFTIIRHSHGATMDTNFRRNWNGAGAAGILRGAYQYFDPWGDPAVQANAIADGLEAVGFGPGDLPPTLDVEQPRGSGDPPLPSPAMYTAKVTTWMNTIRRRLHVEGFIYTGGYYWDQYVQSNSLNDHPLWHAQYFNYPDHIYHLNDTLPNMSCPTSISNAWTAWKFWQFAGGNGRAPGVTGAVDLDVFNGTMAQLRALAVPQPVVDAGTDAAMPDATSTDGSSSDSSVNDVVELDASDALEVDVATTDAAMPQRDSAPTGDASSDGSMPTTMPAGCSCRTGSMPTSSSRAALLGFVAIAFTARRRRARQRRCA